MKYLILTLALISYACSDPVPPSGDFQGAQNMPDEDAVSVRQQIDKANRIAFTRFGLQPVNMSQVRVEIKPTDPRCTDRTAYIVSQNVPPGTSYDQDPNYDRDPTPGHVEICVGGRYIDPEHGQERIITTLEAVRTGVGVWYEMEHLILYHRDRARYIQTMNHTPFSGHPILGDE